MSSRVSYLPLRLDAAAIARKHNQVDWPGVCRIDAQALRLVWVPFDGTSGDALIDAASAPMLGNLRAALRTPSSLTQDQRCNGQTYGVDPMHQGAARIVYAPLWVLCDSARSDDSAVFSADSGDALSGTLTADPVAARAQLVFCLFLSIFCTLIGGGFLFAVMGASLALCRFAFAFYDLALGSLVGLAVSLSGVGWYFVRMRSLLPDLLVAPLRRVVEGRVSLPFDVTWLRLVKASGMLVTVQLPLLLASLFMNDSVVSPWVIAIGLAQFACGLAFAVTALRVSHHQPLASGPRLALNSREPVGELVSVTLRVALFSLCGGLAAGAVSLCGIAEIWQLTMIPSPTSAMATGAEVCALLALVLAPLSWRARLVLGVAMFVRSLAGLWLGPWLGVGACMGAVTFTAWRYTEKVGLPQGTSRGSRLAVAIRQSWRFNLGATTGRLVGHSLAVFFFGFTAGAIGEIVGERIVGTMAFLSDDRQRPADDGVVTS